MLSLQTRGVTVVSSLFAVVASAALAQDLPGPTRDVPAPIDSLQDLQDAGRLVFKLADENHDGQISQKEAIDAANLILGGYFFRADVNGDGILSPEEAKEAREAFLNSRPWVRSLRTVMGRLPNGNEAANPNRNTPANLAALVDVNNDQRLQASELRQAIQTAVQGAFAAADTNRDGLLSPVEVSAALVSAARSAMRAAFQQADIDNNGGISQSEFEKAIMGPAHAAFSVMDANHDGQLSPEEVQTARKSIMSKLQQLTGRSPGAPGETAIFEHPTKPSPTDSPSRATSPR